MPTSDRPLHIDIPVKLEELKIAFSIASLAFEGDLPASIFHLQLITKDLSEWGAASEVVAVFHTNAGHVTGAHATRWVWRVRGEIRRRMTGALRW